MASRECHRWFLSGIIFAFLELALAYILLCGSAFIFMASEFLRLLGLHLPCPCTGILGYRSRELCLHKLLFDWPMRKIYTIQTLARNSLPYDLIWNRDQEQNSEFMWVSDRRIENGGLKIEDQTCLGSVSGSRLKRLADKETKFDAKGTKTTNQKQKGVSRRHRKVGIGYGKSPLVLLDGKTQSATSDVSSSRNNAYQTKNELNESVGEIDTDLQDDGNGMYGNNLEDISCDEVNANISYRNINETVKDLSSVENLLQITEDKLLVFGNEANVIKILEQALAEEISARAALSLELEKERAAAATAADEAMAMILRLQADKASLEMEAKHYERMMEERFVYDEEEMNVLKEIIVRRERENHFLEKELEAYQQIGVSENGLSENDTNTRNPDQNLDFSGGKGIRQEENLSCGKEPIVYDVHVIEDITEVLEKGDEKESESVHGESLGSDSEIEWLRERLRTVQKEKVGFKCSVQHSERISARLKLMEELVNQLREIQQLAGKTSEA